MKQKLLFLLVVLAARTAAQQVPQYSMYAFNQYAFNPAYAGMENTLVATAAYRQQWSGLKGAPVTQHLNAHLPIFAISSGVGVRIQNSVIGAHRSTLALLSYSYQWQVARKTIVSFGVSAGYQQYVLDGSILRAPQGSYIDPDFSHNDQLLPLGKERAGGPLTEAGVFVQASQLEIGLSVQPALATRFSGGYSLEAVQHGFLYGAYSIRAGEDLLIKPSVLVKTDLIKTQVEISAFARWRENIFAGASYRGFGSNSKDAAVLIAGLRLNEKTTLAYSFDIPISALNTTNRGTHELLLHYSLNKPIGVGKLPPVIYNPRFL